MHFPWCWWFNIIFWSQWNPNIIQYLWSCPSISHNSSIITSHCLALATAHFIPRSTELTKCAPFLTGKHWVNKLKVELFTWAGTRCGCARRIWVLKDWAGGCGVANLKQVFLSTQFNPWSISYIDLQQKPQVPKPSRALVDFTGVMAGDLAKAWEAEGIIRSRGRHNGQLTIWPSKDTIGIASQRACALNHAALELSASYWVERSAEPAAIPIGILRDEVQLDANAKLSRPIPNF